MKAVSTKPAEQAKADSTFHSGLMVEDGVSKKHFSPDQLFPPS